MNHKFMTFLILVAVLIGACGIRVINGSGNIKSETRNVGEFDQVSVCCGMELIIRQGEEATVKIEADDNILPEIDSRVSGDRLSVDFSEGLIQTSFRPSTTVKVYVTIDELHSTGVSGGGSLDMGAFETGDLDISLSGGSRAIVDQLLADSLDIDISGGGRMTADQLNATRINIDLSGGSQVIADSIAAENLDLEISGGGRLVSSDAGLDDADISLSGGSTTMIDLLNGGLLSLRISGGGMAQIGGEIVEQMIELSGSSQYDAPDLKSQRTKIEAGGNAAVWATELLDADLSGGSTVEYRGNPIITQNLSGGSQVIPLRGR